MGLFNEAMNKALFPEDDDGQGVKTFLERAKEGDDAEGESGGIMALALRGEARRGRGGMANAWDIVLAGEQPAEKVEKENVDEESGDHPHRPQSLLRRTVGSGLQGFAHGMGLPEDASGAFRGLGSLLGGATMATLVEDTKAQVARETALHQVRTEHAAAKEKANQIKEEQRILKDAEKIGRQRVRAQEKEKQRKEKAKQPPSATRVAFTQFGDTLRDHADGLGRDIMAGISGLTARGLDAARRTARSWRKGGADSTEPVAGVDVISSDGQKIA